MSPEGERADVTRTYEELVRRPRNLTYEHSVRLADGQTRWVLWVDVPLPDADGVCREFQSVGRDITERKLAEQALRESEERYRRIVDTAREGIWMLDAQMKTTFANQRMTELLGLSVAALSGRSLLDFVEPSSREEARSHFEQCRAGLLHQCDLHLRLPDGSTLWTLVSANPIRDAAGVSVGLLALVTDITDRKGMEADLQVREALFRTVFESAPLGIALLSLDDTRRRVNPALARMLGYTVEEMEARTVRELTHAEDLQADGALFQRLAAGEIDQYSLEKRLLHRDGSAVWVRLNCSLTRGAQPQVVGLVEDISQQRTTESALRTLFERTALATGDRFFQQLVSHLAGVLEVDAAFCNEVRPDGQLRCLALYQVSGRHGHVHQAIAGSPCARLLEGQTCLHQEGADHECPVFRQLSGEPARSFMGVPIMGGDGQVMGSVGVLHSAALKNPGMMQEILQVFALRAAAELERRRRDEEVRALTADLEQRVAQRTAQLAVQALAMDSTMEGMSVLRNDRYIYMNEPHAAMYGFTPAELMDKTWRALYSPEEQARLERETFPVLQREGRWRGEVKGQRKNGELFDAEISLVATSDGHLVCSCRDITVSHAARELLNQRSQVLERATRAKDEFLAAMSHELRTPLAGILMASESLRGNVYGPLNEKQSVMIGHVEESGKHLLELINDILDLSKIEAGKVDLNPEPISAGSLCAAVVRMIRHPAAEKKLQVSVEVDPPDLVLDADPRRLKQMLLNLLGNAVKFTPEGGGIGLRVARSTDREQILLTVSDTGIGDRVQGFSQGLPALHPDRQQPGPPVRRHRSRPGPGAAHGRAAWGRHLATEPARPGQPLHHPPARRRSQPGPRCHRDPARRGGCGGRQFGLLRPGGGRQRNHARPHRRLPGAPRLPHHPRPQRDRGVDDRGQPGAGCDSARRADAGHGRVRSHPRAAQSAQPPTHPGAHRGPDRAGHAG
jgi:PAS domain S-box-containing protein